MKRILVIDDDFDIRNLFKIVLTKAGYEVLSAPDGEIASELQARRPFDLVITDIFMPRKEGIETIIDLKSKYPKTKIIAVSGGFRQQFTFTDTAQVDDVLDLAKDLGADCTLDKPVKQQLLLETVNQLL